MTPRYEKQMATTSHVHSQDGEAHQRERTDGNTIAASFMCEHQRINSFLTIRASVDEKKHKIVTGLKKWVQRLMSHKK